MFTRKFPETLCPFSTPSIHLASKPPKEQQKKTNFVFERIICTIKRMIYLIVNT